MIVVIVIVVIVGRCGGCSFMQVDIDIDSKGIPFHAAVDNFTYRNQPNAVNTLVLVQQPVEQREIWHLRAMHCLRGGTCCL